MAAALALFTSATYGVSNYLGPRLARGAPYLLLLVLGQGVSLLLSLVVVAGAGAGPPGAGDLAWAAVAGVGNAVGLVLFYEAARVGPLSIVMPLGSVGVAIPVVAGQLSGESVSAVQVAGIVLAVAGLVLVARRPVTPVGPVRAGDDRPRAVALSLMAAVAFGVFLATIKPAAQESAPWAVAVSRLTLVAILMALAVRARVFGERRSGRQLALLALPGVLLFAGTLSYAAATRLGDLTVVSVLGSLFTVVTVALAVIFDHERLPRIGWVGVAAAVVGVVLLSAQ